MHQNRKIVFLINPISGTLGKSSLKELITRRTKEKGIAFSILPTNADGNYDFLLSIIGQEKITDIVICGGDGTVNAVAAALTGTDIRIGIIPMGSGNGLAFAAKIPKNPVKALEIVYAGHASRIDGFHINGQFSCMLCGIGFDAAVARDFAGQPRRGLQTYIKVALRNFIRAHPYRFGISPLSSEGSARSSFSVEALFIDIANSDQFGNNVKIAPRASLNDGLLDIVIVKKGGRLRMLLSAIRQVLGGYPVDNDPPGKKQKNILYFQTPGLQIANPEMAPLHIDGDPAATAPDFHIAIVPNAINLMRPLSTAPH
jgi:YegS/Rv2252/BmrU family lipid kinase